VLNIVPGDDELDVEPLDSVAVDGVPADDTAAVLILAIELHAVASSTAAASRTV